MCRCCVLRWTRRTCWTYTARRWPVQCWARSALIAPACCCFCRRYPLLLRIIFYFICNLSNALSVMAHVLCVGVGSALASAGCGEAAIRGAWRPAGAWCGWRTLHLMLLHYPTLHNHSPPCTALHWTNTSPYMILCYAVLCAVICYTIPYYTLLYTTLFLTNITSHTCLARRPK